MLGSRIFKLLSKVYSVESFMRYNIYLQVYSQFKFAICRECGRTLPHWIRINHPRSLSLWYIKGVRNPCPESVDPMVPLTDHDLRDLGSLILIQITLEERTLHFEFVSFRIRFNFICYTFQTLAVILDPFSMS